MGAQDTALIGTPGAAILLSIVAIVLSVVIPLELENRRRRWDLERAMADSWRRVHEACLSMFNKTETDLDLAARFRTWVELMIAESHYPGSCLFEAPALVDTLVEFRLYIDSYETRRERDRSHAEVEMDLVALRAKARQSQRAVLSAAETRFDLYRRVAARRSR